MRVYRLEHPKYGTPYRINWKEVSRDVHQGLKTLEWKEQVGDLQSQMLDAHRGPSRRPVSDEFPYTFKELEHYCGCLSRRELKVWFSGKGGWSKWLRYGWKVVEYEVDRKHIIMGVLQCIFKMKHATRIS